MSTHIHHSKHADLINAIRTIIGYHKKLPDVYDIEDVLDACVSCPKYTGKGLRCPRHRHIPAGVL